jgi:signal transduction histidine kinase
MTGKVQLNLQAVDLAAVVEQAIVSLRPAAEVKGVRLSPGPGGAAAALVHGDPDRLQQVSWNLISNAIKFTPRGGTVEVEIVGCDGFVEVVVRDTGIGIAPAFMPHVFDRFRQGDGSLVREHGGLGLGLAIARDLVQLHGGSIAASSGGVGLGATFRVRLPLMAASAVTALDQSAAISSAGKGERTSAAGVLPAGDGQ